MSEPGPALSENVKEVWAKARTRALVWGIVTGLGSRLLVLAAPLLTIPVTLRYLGTDIFGFWMVVTSITSMAMFADLGLGNGLLTRLAACFAIRDYSSAKTLISTAYVILGTLALTILSLVWIIVPSLDWASFLSANNGLDQEEIRIVAGLCLVAFAVTIPLSLIQRVQYAFQEAWKSNVWQVIGAVVTVLAVYTGAALDAGYAVIIAVAVFSNPVVLLLNNIYHYSRNAQISPSISSASSKEAGSLLRVGLGFLFLSILTSISLNVDNLIVARVADLPTVSEFAITTKLFSLLALAVTLVALPLWPANGEALARGDTSWVKRTTRRMMILSTGFVAFGGFILFVMRDFIAGLWLGDSQRISAELAVSLVVWATLIALASPYFAVQNSVGLLRYQFIGWLLFASSSIPLKFYFYTSFGLHGVPLAGALAYLVFMLPTALLGYRATLRQAERNRGV